MAVYDETAGGEHIDAESLERIEAQGASAERLRIAAWLHAKSDETEALLLLAADRAAPESRAVNQAFATKTRVILEVLARMIEKNVLPLTDRKAKGDA